MWNLCSVCGYREYADVVVPGIYVEAEVFFDVSFLELVRGLVLVIATSVSSVLVEEPVCIAVWNPLGGAAEASPRWVGRVKVDP